MAWAVPVVFGDGLNAETENRKPGEHAMNLQTLIHYQLSEGLTEQELAADIGVSNYTILRILKGRKPKDPEILRKLACYFRMDVNLLQFGKLGLQASKENDKDPGNSHDHQLYRKVPLLSWAQVRDVVEGRDAASFLATRQRMVETELPGAQVFALPVPDDSMEPLFHKGELFFVNPDLEPAAGDYVVALDQMAEAIPDCLRQLKGRGKRYVLHALNHNYQDTPLTGHQKIIGRVVRLRMNL